MSTIHSVGSKVIGYITKPKCAEKVLDWFDKDLDKALAYSTIGSIVAKDGIGCAMYVYQSLNNKDIPAKRRSFVASMDLTNGALMIAAQILMFFGMRKVSRKLFNKFFGSKIFAPQNLGSAAEQLRMNQRAIGLTPIRKPPIFEVIYKHRDKLSKGFGDILDLVAATIIGKRIVVPFIATPLAGKMENWMNKKFNIDEEKLKDEEKISPAESTPNVETSKPAMQGANVNIISSEDGNTNLLDRVRKVNV